MEFGCGFASSFEAGRQAQVAEALGFDYIGFFDSPALEPDIWLTVADALRSTERITVGTYVLIPHLRHPMAQASAIATILHQAPGRLEVGLGTGFTGRMAMGQRPLTWAYLRRFVEQLRGLLRGDEVLIDGAVHQMIHPPGYAPPRPIAVPLVIAANGPKGIALARECDGLIYGGPLGDTPSGFARLQLPLAGIPLEAGEAADSPRVIEAARLLFTLRYHLAYDGFASFPVERLPGGAEWLEMIRRFPEATRHLKVHDRHTVAVSEHDHEFSERHRGELEAFAAANALTPDRLAERVDALAALGATRVMGPTMRPDWERGLRSFASILTR
ncbi:MAG: LLM class flavin-dependent oxidoreductase [Acidimicrobiales bacterium]